MTRRSALVLLAVFGIGVFLAGLELMITAVALPSILEDLADPSKEHGLGRAAQGLAGSSTATCWCYILTMPLAGRMTDLWGARRLFMAALVDLRRRLAAGRDVADRSTSSSRRASSRPRAAACSCRSGRPRRVAPVRGAARPRALGVVGALTFLGMAAGPFVGAAILGVRQRRGRADRPAAGGPLTAFLTPAWRWVFYVNVPIGLDRPAPRLGRVGGLGHAAPGRAARPAAAPSGSALALLLGLVGLTLVGTTDRRHRGRAGRRSPLCLLAAAAVTRRSSAVLRGLRVADPFLDPRLFREPTFSAAALVSLLTGYAFATAIIGAAVFVDRVLYGGPDEQRLALGALAGATAVGALGSGFAVRVTVAPRS